MKTRLQWFAVALPIIFLAACKGTITSPVPLLDQANASHPFPAAVEIEASTFNGQSWENIEGKARLTLSDGAYRVTNPNELTPTPETFLFRPITDDLLVAQANNGEAWAYGLIVHTDKYYLFAFNREDGNCLTLTPAERERFGVVIEGDRCLVSNLTDLTGLLLHLRERYPDPTSAFVIR